MKLPLIFTAVVLMATGLQAETGYDAWLRYAVKYTQSVPSVVASSGDSLLIGSARAELIRGFRGMTGRTLRIESGVPQESSIVLSTLDKLPSQWNLRANLESDGYWLKTLTSGGIRYTVITAPNDRGVLYGAFALLRKMSLGESIAELDERHSPATPVRWVNQWDNLDGSIERGYGGRSIFWENGQARKDLSRVADYGRLLASVGINGCSINNVNADPRILTPETIAQVARIADAFRPWGVRVLISVDFGSPKSIGGLDTFDPLDPQVAAWWKAKADEIYRAIPDFGGFVLKADSEGRVGPSTYGRTHADAANVVARALKPHGGRSSIAASSTTITWTGGIRRTTAPAPLTTISNRSTASSTTTSSSRSRTAPSIFRCANRRRRYSALWKKRTGDRTADHAGIHGPGAAHGLSGADVERDARFRHARTRPRHPGEETRHRFRGRRQRRGWTTTGSAIIFRRPISTVLAAWRGIRI